MQKKVVHRYRPPRQIDLSFLILTPFSGLVSEKICYLTHMYRYLVYCIRVCICAASVTSSGFSLVARLVALHKHKLTTEQGVHIEV
jgi:hypothetical protein